MSWETGKRTIFDVMNEHVGHSIQIRNVYQGDMITGINVVCMTCGFSLLRQDAPEPIPIQYEEVVGSEEVIVSGTGWDSQDTGCVNDTGWDTSDREWST